MWQLKSPIMNGTLEVKKDVWKYALDCGNTVGLITKCLNCLDKWSWSWCCLSSDCQGNKSDLRKHLEGLDRRGLNERRLKESEWEEE
jgi:hypothetical protein